MAKAKLVLVLAFVPFSGGFYGLLNAGDSLLWSAMWTIVILLSGTPIVLVWAQVNSKIDLAALDYGYMGAVLVVLAAILGSMWFYNYYEQPQLQNGLFTLGVGLIVIGLVRGAYGYYRKCSSKSLVV